jgi:hypothetical protein
MSIEPKYSQSEKTTNQISQWLAMGVAIEVMHGTRIGAARSQKNKKG